MITARRLTLNRKLCLMFLILASTFSAAAGNGGYSVVKKIPIPGQGSWDYLAVDEAARRLYVSHGTQVEVLDIDALSIVGTIPRLRAFTASRSLRRSAKDSSAMVKPRPSRFSI